MHMRATNHHLAAISLTLALAAACSPSTPEAAPTPKAPAESAAAALNAGAHHIIPLPMQLTPKPGGFRLEHLTSIRLSDHDDGRIRELGEYARELVLAEIGLDLPVGWASVAGAPAGSITLSLSDGAGDAPEQYRLTVTSQSVTIAAPTHAGLFYGLQTFRQLLPTTAGDADAAWVIPAVEIEDRPRFTYRGMHLDVGRHFFPVDFIKRYIDLMAMYKMNTFHWHLTEDQGWRIEIKKYPRLTEVGSCREETILEKNFDPYVGDGIRYCGFYTQDEVREVVAYAASRHVIVIPEIEMPGHSVAALAAYPEFACTDGPFEVSTVWGVKPDIYCPKEETFAFLEDVLSDEYGLDLSGWRLSAANAISADGLTIVGAGFNPLGQIEAWLAHIPEPSTLWLLALSTLALLRRGRV